MVNNEINYLDLFSGIGGFAKGVIQAGIKLNNHYYSEIDKNCINIYEKHFPQSNGLGNIETITKEITNRLPKINLITFGFPCQDLSIAGKQAGLNGNRSSLFFEAIRLIQELKPDYFIFENVKGLLHHQQGKTFEIILQEISNIGYDGQWQLVNSSWFLPQNRERIYFIGYNRTSIKSPPKVFPITRPNRCSLEIQSKTESKQQRLLCEVPQNDRKNELLESGRISKGRFDTNRTVKDKATIEDKTAANKTTTKKPNRTSLKQLIGSVSQSYRVYGTDGSSTTLTANAGGVGAKTGLYAVEKDNNEKTNEVNIQNNQTTSSKGTYNGYNIRRLTPLECERLQGFPDGWTDGISDTQRYKCLGNAVTVPVVEEIIRRLFDI
ncbi:MAG TPA: DNA cytosine methyltransferase [Rickettsiales bacterium]|nr:DNA cytosine methyltransferase [Rickettsiales bacterium]